MRRATFVLRLSSLFLLAACGSKSTGPEEPPPVANVALSTSAASVMVGQTTTLTATPRDAQGQALSGRSISWSSANSAIASVSGGTVTGVAVGGPVTITATSEGKSASAQITVTGVPVASVTVSGASTVEAGKTITLSAVARDANDNELTGRTVVWESGNTALATVSGGGVVTGVAAGTVTITARIDGVAGTRSIIVTPAVVPIWSASDELRIGGGYVGLAGRMAVASDGRAVAVQNAQLWERSASGTWSTTPITFPGVSSIYSPAVDPNGVFWVSGSNGLIAQRAESGWVVETTGTTETLFDLALRGDGRGFAVGSGMVLERSAAGVWTRSTLLDGYNVTDVGMPTGNFALATGGLGNGVGVSARWDGTTWTPVSFTGALINFRPTDLLVVSPTEAYATGMIGTNLLSARYTIAEWNGTGWVPAFQRPAGEVYPFPATGITRCPNGSIYTGLRYGAIYRKQGGGWSQWTPNGVTVSNGFTITCDHDGAILVGSSDGMLLRSTNGANWSLLRWRPSLTSIAIGSPTSAFAATGSAVLRLSGNSWERTPIPLPNGAPVTIPPAVWAQGSDAVVTGDPAGRFNGSSWVWSRLPSGVGTAGVWGTSITQVFAVGTLSRIERYNGSSWSEITGLLPGTWRVEGIHGNGNIMVAGSFYGVIRFDGTSWNQIAAPPGGIGVFRVFPGGDIYNVKIGRLQRWTGSEWVEVGCPCSTIGTVPAAVAARAPDEIYAFVNAAGPTVQVHRWDGTAWRMIQTFSGRVSAAAWAGNQGIAVGDDGLVLRATTNSAIQ